MRILFQHGKDPQLGDKPIAALRQVSEDDEGVYCEAELFDGLPPLLVDGLRSGQYGASMRFVPIREEIDQFPKRTDPNPDGLPERTVVEAKVREFGPVTFPAYDGATAHVRSRDGRPDTIRRERVLRGDEKVTPTRPLVIDGVRLRPGRSRLLVTHPWVRRRPTDFRPAWAADSEVRAMLGRMQTSTRTRTFRTARRSYRLPGPAPSRRLSRPAAKGFRLP
jgi:hypothetical protein